MDKEDIIADAIRIGTYETSILPYEDCCVLFSPKHPILHADVSEAHRIYESLEVDALIEKAYEAREFKGFEVGEPIE
jgi:thiamine biosynthesis protein ThiI